MGKKRRKALAQSSGTVTERVANRASLPRDYRRACRLAQEGRTEEARRLYLKLVEREGTTERVRALARNDMAVLEVVAGRAEEARAMFRDALGIDAECSPARLNLALLDAESPSHGAEASRAELVCPAEVVAGDTAPGPRAGDSDATRVTSAPSPGRCASDLSRGERFGGIVAAGVTGGAPSPGRCASDLSRGERFGSPVSAAVAGGPPSPGRGASDLSRGERIGKGDGGVKIALVSFLFNWPATGGGNIHTVELARFLARAGYQVRHFFARYAPWGIGRLGAALDVPSEALEFDDAGWNVPAIQQRFRTAIDAFAPDCVLITDAWNMKPLLAEAVRDYPYFLRFQALECLCPLNNLRLLAEGPEQVEQCPRHQLAAAETCRRCVEERGRHSGALHQVERDLAGVGTAEYDRVLRLALDRAEAVLVHNPLTEAILSPYARRVRVVPWGMDPARFPWPPPEGPAGASPDGVATLFMAAVAGEFIKGYHVLHEACRRLRQRRTDFELVVTFDPPGPIDEFTRSVGWVSQDELPRHYHAADICVVPTIAQEGLSRTSVEAMASGRPVIASRIGGLPSTVSDGATGLLFEPGDADDLARKIETLLDDPPLRRRMGLAGRRRFETDFTWQRVIERHYAPLLKAVERRSVTRR